MPKFVSYIRVSTDDQKKSGLGEAAQQERVKAWVALQLTSEKYAGYTIGPMIQEDESVSASVPLFKRKDGQLLKHLVGPGDVLVIAVHDRSFRNMKDAAETKEYFDGVGATMHFCNLNIDLATKEGELIFYIMVATAQWERRAISERTKAAQAAAKKRGEHLGGPPPSVGFKVIEGKSTDGTKKRRWLKIDDTVTATIRWIRLVYDTANWSFRRISDFLEERAARREKRPRLPDPRTSPWAKPPFRYWTERRVQQAYYNCEEVLRAIRARRKERRAQIPEAKKKMAKAKQNAGFATCPSSRR